MAILLIHTGGTIGMAATSDGFAPREGVVEQAVTQLCAAADAPGRVDVTVLAPLIDSALITPADWNRIAQAIYDARQDYDGFVVTHGTDTLAQSAAALCIALAGLERPVIVTGAMRPLTLADSDGWQNLRDAFAAAINAPAGVWGQFAGRRLHGARMRKLDSEALDAFRDSEGSLAPPLLPAPVARLNLVRPHEVGVLTVAPGGSEALIEAAVERLEGMVLRCFGTGTIPDSPRMRAALRRARERAVPVIAVSQCTWGGVRLGTYEAGKLLHDCGVLDGRDMTAEMAYVKLHYALSMAEGFKERCQMLAQPLCGEMRD